jgi:hypothetical protein
MTCETKLNPVDNNNVMITWSFDIVLCKESSKASWW